MAEPGLTTDILVRGLIVGASKHLGTRIVMEYRPGAGGSLAAAFVSTAKPDGYTLFSGTASTIIDGTLTRKVPFSPLKSFTPIIAFAASEHTATVVHPNAPWKTFKEFVDDAKKNPDKIRMGVSPGSGMHMAMEFVKHQEGLDWVYVPFPSAGPARTAVAGGHLDSASVGTDWGPLVESGMLRVLVTHGKSRALPDIPTLMELGYDFDASMPQAILGPAGLPADVVAKLEDAFAKGMETPEFKTALQQVFVSPFYLNSKGYGDYLRQRWATYEKLYKQFGVIKEAATQPE